MRIALFYGHYSSNIGDVAINRGLVDLLKKSFGKEFSLTVFFLNGDGMKLNGRKSFGESSNISFEPVYVDVALALESMQKPKNFLQRLGVSDFDLVLVNGGEHLFSLKNNPNWMNLFWRSLPLISADSNNIRSIVLPSTIGFFEHKSGMQYAEKFLYGSTDFLCRDVRSFDYLTRELGLRDAKLLPDLAFNIDFEVDNDDGVNHDETIGIIVRPDKMGLRVGAEKSKVKYAEIEKLGFSESLSYKFGLRASRAILSGSENSIKIFIQTDTDRKISEELYDALEEYHGSGRVELVAPNSIEDYLKELSTCGCIVTSRLHAAILSCVVNTPCVAYYFEEHGHKMPGVFELLLASSSCFLLNEEGFEENAENILGRIEKAKGRQIQIKQKIDTLKKESVAYFRNVLSTPFSASNSTSLAEVPEWLVGASAETASNEVRVALAKKNIRVKEVYDAHTRRFKKLNNENKNLKKENESLKKRQISGYLKAKIHKILSNRD